MLASTTQISLLDANLCHTLQNAVDANWSHGFALTRSACTVNGLMIILLPAFQAHTETLK